MNIIHQHHKGEKPDYIYNRDLLKELIVSDGGYEGLTTSDKLIACKWFLVNSHTERLAQHTADIETRWTAEGKTYTELEVQVEASHVDQQWSLRYHAGMKRARQRRVEMVTAFLINHIGPLSGIQVAHTLEINNLTTMYVQFGNRGIQQGYPIQGLWDYLYSHTGTMFENQGFLECGATTIQDLSFLEVRDKAVEILNTGVLY